VGGVVARIHWAVLEFGKCVSSARGRTPLVAFVASATGYTRATITRTLDKLHTLGLLPMSPGTSRKSMDRAARRLGVLGTAADRTHRHLIDRELHRWWIEELEWRSRPGKKRGVRAVPPSPLALPIAAPARARYGRFPTGEGGRADYHAARTIVSTSLGCFPLPHSTAV
jgi:hypothetical protein